MLCSYLEENNNNNYSAYIYVQNEHNVKRFRCPSTMTKMKYCLKVVIHMNKHNGNFVIWDGKCLD